MNKKLLLLLLNILYFNISPIGFTEDTIVRTEDGYTKIQSIKVGDKILCINQNGFWEIGKVNEIIVKKVKTIYCIPVGKEFIYCDDFPFMYSSSSRTLKDKATINGKIKLTKEKDITLFKEAVEKELPILKSCKTTFGKNFDNAKTLVENKLSKLDKEILNNTGWKKNNLQRTEVTSKLKINYIPKKNNKFALKENGTPITEGANELTVDMKHVEIEVFKNKKHIGAFDVNTFEQCKDAVNGRKID